MKEPVCVDDVEKIAKNKLSPPHWAYLSGGAGDEQTARDNLKAFERLRLRPQVLEDVSKIDVSTLVLGTRINFPVCASPMGLIIISSNFNNHDAPLDIASGATAAGTGYTLSNAAGCSIEEIGNISTASPKWIQLSIYKDRKMVEMLVRRAEASGFQGVFVTVDMPVYDRRLRELRNPFTLTKDHFRGLLGDLLGDSHKPGEKSKTSKSLINDSVRWSDIVWLKQLTKLPVVLKGIQTGEMAAKAVECGVDGILVSNHGGRQLDGSFATIDVLPEVVRAVDGRCEVYMDGGVRSGTDVLKAVALGAKAVFVGRPLAWGAVWKGAEGVERVLNMLRDEFVTAMQLIGCTSIDELQRRKNLVVPDSFYTAKL